MNAVEFAAELDAIKCLRNPKAYNKGEQNTVISKRIPLDQLRKQNATNKRQKNRVKKSSRR